MNFTSVPVIVCGAYIIGEIYKAIFRKRQEAYKLIPVIVSLSGGILGIIVYLTYPEMLFEAANIWTALEIGLVSGASATGANQIIKQLFFKEEKNLNVDQKK